ncbi:peptidase domain-containing ABC transporter [Chitinophaga filiformis]|uniref:peptidase domain-containing ABC transporter n=1 Tax=Chitinophaga filiformis TaxID=104663 RepID=UPI001F19503A|nr:peptidase domain-containing ABC transporter [Chitinophaga filiformis]MCF6407050.1 peptidase domain-containing ABC transporter [Chitinophaga filiformis]
MFNTKKFPRYKQSDAMDCGPTCLKMVAAHYGRQFPLQYLRELSKSTRQGVTVADLVAAGESLGFKTFPAELPFTVLSEKAPLPCILHWEKQHFVVLHSITATHAYVADPAVGRTITYTKEQFLKAWRKEEESTSGRALFLEPTAGFYAQESIAEPVVSLKTLYPYLRAHKKELIPVFATLILAAGCSLVIPMLTRAIADSGIRTHDIPLLLLICAGQLMLFLGRMVMDFIRARLLYKLGTGISIQMLRSFLLKLMQLPLPFFDNRHAGDNMQRIADNQRVEDFLTSVFVTFVMAAITTLVLGCVLLYYHLLIFLLFVTGAIASIIWANSFQEKRKMLDQQKFKALAANQQILLEIFGAMQEIKLTGSEEIKSTQWQQLQERSFGLKLETLRMDQFMQGIGLFINEIKNVIITSLAAILVIKGELSLGTMLAVTYICGQLNTPVLQLADFIRSSQNTLFSLQRMAEVQHEPNEDEQNTTVLPALTGNGQDIRLNNIQFRYGHQHSSVVLDDIHLTIPAGKITAIVGMSGSGKTTLLKLLLKFYAPVKGEIRIGEQALASINAKAWRRQCGVVMQDGYIFMDTIANNIYCGNSDRNTERLHTACKMANIHDFFTSMPFGYDTVVGKDGYGLSEGQKQRLLIARMIYRDPAYIFLDEATNSLDAHNERAIINSLEHFFPGKTVVIVAHRLSTVKHAHQIVVMDQGKIAEYGSHQELIAARGAYYQLIKNQLELGQ